MQLGKTWDRVLIGVLIDHGTKVQEDANGELYELPISAATALSVGQRDVVEVVSLGTSTVVRVLRRPKAAAVEDAGDDDGDQAAEAAS